MYAEINPHDLRRCPLPPIQESEENESGDVGFVSRDQPESSTVHREGYLPANAASPERI